MKKEKLKIQRESLWQRGSFYLDLFPVLKTIGYDFNIYSLEGEGTGDWVFNGGIGGRLSFLRPGFYLSSALTPYYLAFLHNREENFLNHDAVGEFGLRVSRLNFYAGYFDIKEKTRPSFELGPRIVLHRRSLVFSTEVSPGSPLSFEVLGRRDEYQYSNLWGSGGFSPADRTESTYLLHLRRRIFSATHLVFTLGYRRSFFRYDPRNRNAVQGWGEVRINFPEVSRIKGSFSLGFKGLRSVKEGGLRFQGIKGRGDVTAEVGPFLLSMSYHLDWIYSVFVVDIIRVRNLKAGGGVKILRDNFRIQGWHSRGDLLFLYSGRIDKMKNSGIQFLFRVSPRSFVGLQYFWLKITSSVHQWSRLINTVGGVVVYEI